jgi:hypothetical protein
LLPHQESSSHSEDSVVHGEEEPESGTWQTRSNRNMSTALLLTGLPLLCSLYIACSSIPLEFLELVFTNFLMMILVQENTRYCREYYAGKGDENQAPQEITLEEIYLLALILKMGLE